MTVKLNPTSWLPESLCYCVCKTHLHTPLIYGYIAVNEIERVVGSAIRN